VRAIIVMALAISLIVTVLEMLGGFHRTDAEYIRMAETFGAVRWQVFFKIVLPYNISTPLLFHLLEFGDKVKDMHFMLQKEVVDRITASPNSKEYGRLSVMIQYFCKPTFLFEVPPGSFNPPPKVTSAVFRLEPYAVKPVIAKDEKAMARLVSHVFTQRRKTLRNSLKGMLAEDGFEQAGVDPMARPETLTLAQFVALADQMVA
jgi:16S rRNA (adenine1518-N6/adenine1519-N6)-dimethyltransferase